MKVRVSSEIAEKHGVFVEVIELSNLKVKKSGEEFLKFREMVFDEIRKKYSLETLKDNKIIRAYRDFYWSIGIDPTKIRPSSEALVRRILAKKDLPLINNLVDSYNLASALTLIAMGAYDVEKIKGELEIRYSSNEEFIGIGNKKMTTNNHIVLSDEEKIISIYPYRDSEKTKITENTTKAIIVLCGVKGIDRDYMKDAKKKTKEIVERFCF